MEFIIIMEQQHDYDWSFQSVIAICSSDEEAIKIIDSLKGDLAERIVTRNLKINTISSEYQDWVKSSKK